MSTDDTLIEQVNAILIERSKKALESAKKAVTEEQIRDSVLREALDYFMEEICADASHPTLLSLACEAVGGNPDATVGVGAALVLLTGAADIHDDIIDQSLTKQSKETVYGKFGKDIAIVAADVLWVKGMLLLNEACEVFPKEMRQEILRLTKQAFFDIGSAEAKETSLRGNVDLQPEEFLELIELKVSVATAATKIGAIIGNGTSQQIENLGQYGQTLGVLMTIREEFINMFEPEELTNRFKNECLPLPVLYAFQDNALKKQVIDFLRKGEVSEAELDPVLERIYATSGVQKLGKYMQNLAQKTKENIEKLTNKTVLEQLLAFSLQDMPLK
jgi:geranylgeranyl pyrophosphate synthase